MEILNAAASGRSADSASFARGSWFALSVKSRHEKVVAHLLSLKGLETFLPLYSRRHQYARRSREFELPLFPGYLFCRFHAAACLFVATTPGVLRIVGSGRIPIPVDCAEIEAIQKAIEAGVPLLPHPFWREGEIACITSGALAGIEGRVVSSRHPTRLILSVSLLQRSVLLEIDPESVELRAEAHA